MEYLLIILLFLVTEIFMIWRYKLKIFTSLKSALMTMGVIFLIGIIWDTIAVWRGYWSFDGPHVLDIRIGLLPIEEYLLFIIVPLWMIVFYRLIQEKMAK